MSNKKSTKKKQAPVLVGIPDTTVEDDTDAYASKIGGVPVWLEPTSPPSSKVCQCKICKEPMYLLFQSYVPLPASPYHRVIYVWGCNKRSCMKKEGSFSVVRSHLVDKEYLKAQQQKEEEKKKKEEQKKAAKDALQGFQLGDLWGAKAGHFGNNSQPSSGFGMKTGGFGVKTGGFGVKTDAVKNKETKKDDLADQLDKLTIKDSVQTDTLPKFPGHYLYIDEEKLDNYDTMGIDMSRYQHYLDMEEELLMEMDEETEAWQGETYEKQSLPKGVDKQFKKFMERVECEPTQCIRYEFKGTPLLYSALTPQQQMLINSKCAYCKGPRVFELQLMPNILSVLPATEYALKTMEQVKNKTALPDSWNVGMEFGTILVYVCQKDCHVGSMEDVSYAEESCIVQYEID